MCLNLLLELSLQKGSLSSILDVVLLLLNLWESSTREEDNRSVPSTRSAPLLGFLRRFETICPRPPQNYAKDGANDLKCVTKIYRDLIELPEDDGLEIELRYVAVLIMSHLQTLVEVHIPPQTFNKVSIRAHTHTYTIELR